MAKTIAQLRTEAQTIKNETTIGANTATRVGGFGEDIVDYLEDNPPSGGGGTFATGEDVGDVSLFDELFDLDGKTGAQKALMLPNGEAMGELVEETFTYLDVDSVYINNIPINNKYINSSNAWAAGTSLQNRSINMPVVAGEVYVIKANATNGSIYALLKSNTAVGTPVDFSAYASGRVVLTAGQEVTIKIPSDTTLLYLFRYTKPQASFLPSKVTKKIPLAFATGEGLKNTSIADAYQSTPPSPTLPTMDVVKRIYQGEVVNTSAITPNAKYINSSNAWATGTATYNRCIFVKVGAGETYEIQSNATNGAIYALLKSNTAVGTAVDFSAYASGRIALSASQKAVVTIPSDANLLYIFVNTNGGNFLPSSLTLLPVSDTPKWTTYQKGVMMGDSITYGVYSYWNGSQRYNGVKVADGISDYIGKIVGCQVDNIGKRGSGYVADTRNINNAWEQAQVTDYSQYDFVVMFYGVNDYIQASPIGDASVEAVDTVAGNMMRVFNKIMTDNPNCKILVVGSANTWGQVSAGGDYTANDYYGDATTDYALGYQISGHTLRDYLNMQKTMSDKYHVQFYCMADGGLINYFNIKDTLVDGLHPSLDIRKYIAQEIAKNLI